MNELAPTDATNNPRPSSWLTSSLSFLAEMVLVTVTIGIIAAMWLPAYLTGRPADRQLPEPAHEGAK